MLEGTTRPNPMSKILPILLIIAVIAGAIFFMLPKNKAGAINFQMKFVAGQIDTYKMNMDMSIDMPNMPKQAGAPSSVTMTMSVNINQEVISVNPDGSAKIKVSTSDMQMNMPGMPGGKMPQIPNTEYTITMDKNGKVKKVESAGGPGMAMSGMDMEQMMNQMSGALPKMAVAKGETWKGPVPMPFGGELEVEYKYADDIAVSGRTVAKLDSTYSYNGDIAELAKNMKTNKSKIPAGVNGKIEIAGTGTTLFDRAAGKMIAADMNMDMKMNAANPAAPKGQNMDTNMRVKMHLEKTN